MFAEMKQCHARPFTCPTVGGLCDFTGNATEIANHLATKHEATIFHSVPHFLCAALHNMIVGVTFMYHFGIGSIRYDNNKYASKKW
jgi:hypothetical protein